MQKRENLLYVGIDLHKESHTAVMVNCWNEKLEVVVIENKPSEFKKLAEKVNRKSNHLGLEPIYGLENAYGYGRSLAVWLIEKGYIVKDILQIEEQMLISKTDIENEYIFKEKKEILIKLLQCEHELDRELFIQKYILDEDMDSLCKNFNLSRGAVYNRLWRTKNSLIRKLNISNEVEELK